MSKTNAAFAIKKEKTPRTLTSGDDVCRAIFAPFFAFLFFLAGKISKELTARTTAERSTLELAYGIPKINEVACGIDAPKNHQAIAQNEIG